MNGFANAARVVHVVLLALGIGAAAQLLTFSGALSPTDLQVGAEFRNAVRAQLDSFMLASAPVLLLTLGIGWVPMHSRLRSRALGVALWGLLAAISARWLRPELEAVQAKLGRALDGLPLGAPGAEDWARLVTLSQGLLGAQLVVGLVLLLWSITADGPKRGYGGIQL